MTQIEPELLPESEGSGNVRIEVLAGFVRLVVEDARGALHGDLTPDIARKLASALYDAARQAEQEPS